MAPVSRKQLRAGRRDEFNSNNSGEPAIVPSIEAIEEVQVHQQLFQRIQRGNGAVINLRTKSGTNQFHGRLWEFIAMRRSRPHFFAPANPPLVFNQFGGNAGGPIIKDKTFFFGKAKARATLPGVQLRFRSKPRNCANTSIALRQTASPISC
ncbi:MAG: hypothetical protein U0X75_24225 [Acidobacteriota bacterium]